jgi:cytochrome c biogenesis protein CcdA/thiol-disulfide isomerase/thioredoxin
LAGVVTILSPCILPVLPVVLSGSVTRGKAKPFGIVAGFVLSFTFFTLFLSAIVKATGLSADVLRSVSVFVILGFGLSLVVPSFQVAVEKMFSKLAGKAPTGDKGDGFFGGLLIGLSLGLIWTPCVGPILASIITLAASSSVSTGSFLITLAYSLGTAIPMLAIMYGGRALLTKIPGLLSNTVRIQKVFGILMIVTALVIYFNLDRRFQAYILEKFPSYGAGLTKLEDNQAVKVELDKLKKDDTSILDKLGSGFYLTAPELIEGGRWFNSEPLKISGLKGKVVLVDFWTYTCINCIRTLPYLKNWHEKYADKGLVIIGVHTPEFEFEKSPDNVDQAIKDFGIKYPVMQDNDYATWRAYNNRYWPAKYFIDREGRIRSTHFGEGEYDESERMIQTLLKEAGNLKGDMPIENEDYRIESRTPETYLGYERIDNFSSVESIKPDRESEYTLPAKLTPNHFAYGGRWVVSDEKSEPFKSSQLVFDYEAKNVFLVMGPKGAKTGFVNVYLDDKFVTKITVNEYRLYDIVKLDRAERHELRLDFQDSNLDLFAFTFG